MPELPEVETVARQLAGLVPGSCLDRLEIHDPLLAPHLPSSLDGLGRRRVAEVFRIGKQVTLRLSGRHAKDGPVWISVHLRMTGRLLWRPDPRQDLPEKHLRATFTMVGGERLLFVDPRRFGVIRIVDRLSDLSPAGMEPLSRTHTRAALAELLSGSRQELKSWLLRQDRLVGLGNIYASEILFRSRLSPFRLAGDLEPGETSRLHRATRRVLREAIEHCGTTFSDFQDSQGMSGGFQKLLRVYGREGLPCRTCGHAVQRVVQQGRATFLCERCQPAPA